ncbi:ABC transporter ATP-binding protein [Candidatus Bipolaricaulota bacterium]|nr:ABC transporter ATP-binding protein [Candidatus Bipolaricaulota bacterium]
MAEILETNNLSRRFGGLQAVKKVNLSIHNGTIVGLAGPNGAGKTTLFNLIAGFLTPTSGAVYFEGQDITDWSISRRVSAGITRTFQGTRVFPGLTVRANVLTGTYVSSDKKFFGGGGRYLPRLRPGEAHNSTVDWIMQATHLDNYADTLACNLSYGYGQRLGLAIAIATDPKLLLLDEPFSGTHIDQIGELAELLRILKDRGLTVVLVEHDITSVVNLSDRLVYMESGEVTIPNG